MNISLKENGYICPACELRREEENTKISGPANVPCNQCGGSGRISAGEAEVYSSNVAWARKHYWPEREKRWAIQNAAIARKAGQPKLRMVQ